MLKVVLALTLALCVGFVAAEKDSHIPIECSHGWICRDGFRCCGPTHCCPYHLHCAFTPNGSPICRKYPDSSK
uniref:Cysteine rich secreted protein n=1 Tax=Riptortus pedestris TaxID=329032 RepID=R4WKL0_RIPPE|nr:cysteine rich secreted protein [Riptortus pedestris]